MAEAGRDRPARRPALAWRGGSAAVGGSAIAWRTPTVPGADGRRMTVELTTVADDLVVVHDGATRCAATRASPPTPSTTSTVSRCARSPGRPVRCWRASPRSTTCTSARPSAAASTTTPTARSCGPTRPNRRTPRLMNRAAVAEIVAIDPDAVIVKGDLSQDGTDDEWAAFEALLPHAVRRPAVRRARQPRRVSRAARLRGRPVDHRARAARRPARHGDPDRRPRAACATSQLDWLDDHAGRGGRRAGDRDGPPPAVDRRRRRATSAATTTTSGSTPMPATRSTRCAPDTRPSLGYTAGHTHRHRVRRDDGQRAAVDRGRVREGLPGHVGRVPRVRGRRDAGGASHLGARGAGVEQPLPGALPRLRRRLRGVRDGHARPTAASCSA